MAQHVSHPHLFQYTHYLLLEEPLWLLGTLRFTLSLSFCRHPHGAFHYLFLAFCRVSCYHLSNPLVLGLGIVLLQVDLLESERAFFDRERRSRERSRAIWNPTKDFFERLGLVQWHSLFNLPHERFLPHILWRKLDQGSVHFMSKMPCFPDQFFKLSEQNTDLKSAISLPHLIQETAFVDHSACLVARQTDRPLASSYSLPRYIKSWRCWVEISEEYDKLSLRPTRKRLQTGPLMRTKLATNLWR